MTPELSLYRNAKYRASKKDVPFSITVEDIIINDRCPVCDKQMSIGPRGGHHASPTLDRIIPEKGYVRENIEVICKSCNSVKNDSTLEQLQNIVKYLEERI